MSTLMEELTDIKTVEDKITANKVANFAYTTTAYNDPVHYADGVEAYDPDAEQNIPVANASTLKVNTTILTKGWRAQASAITRMLMNHFLGRCSYNLNKINDLFSLLLTKFMAFLGSPNGIATLDANGRIPYSQLPESAIELKGYWDADTNTPTLADGTGTNGDEYIVSVAGTQNLGSGSQSFNVGDRVLYTSGVWKNITSDFVRTVNAIAPDAQGNIRAVLGTDTFPVTSNFLWSIFYSKLISNWIIGLAHSAKCIGYANGIWVCGTRGNGVWWSEDGISWSQEQGASNTVTVVKLHYANGIWVCGTQGNGVWWSEDGKNWTQGTGDFNVNTVELLDYINGLWVLGQAVNPMAWSEDGKTWTRGNFPSIGSTATITDILYVNGIWVATSYQNGCWWSEDGKNWTQGTGISTGRTTQQLAYANGLWLCGTAGQGIYWSEDGKAWTRGTGNGVVGFDVRGILFANGLWVCTVYNSNSSINGIYWSTDGKAWTRGTGYPEKIYSGLIYVDGLWVCCGGFGNGIYWSENGKAWTQGTGTSSSTGNVRRIVYNNNIWLSIGDTGVWWSEDGKTWFETTVTSETNDILYAKGIWACASTSGVNHTEDLTTFMLRRGVTFLIAE